MPDNSIARQSDLKAVSFSGSTKNTPQIQLVIDLIKSKIRNSKPITTQDIISIYCDWRGKYQRFPQFYKEVYSHSVPTNDRFGRPIYKWQEVTREEFEVQYGTKALAKQWFKSNLASAILKGKLLVISIIEIE